MLSRETYIIAVSGGVDSVVLLHKLSEVQPPHITYIIAHFDHGIRKDSAKDAEFVKKLAKSYGLEFVTERAELGSSASEDVARRARYGFLKKVMKDRKATAIITAHHQDDVLETMIVNILRGTSPRGLIGFTQSGILRPLINKTKQELKDYAKEHKLEWQEDITNQDTKYMRNYVRINLLPKLKEKKETLLNIRGRVVEAYREIDDQAKKMLVQATKQEGIIRGRFVVLPYVVQKELMATMLRMHGVEINRKMVERSTIAVKTLQPGKHIELTKAIKIHSYKNSVVVEGRPV